MKAKNKWNFGPGPLTDEWISLCIVYWTVSVLLCTVLTLWSRNGNPLSFPRGEILLEPIQQLAYISYQSFFISLCTCLN